MKFIHVAAAVIRRNGRILICSRPSGKPPAGWEFPGGKIEPGETAAEALRRELREELALEAVILDPIFEITHQTQDATIRLSFLRCLIAAEAVPVSCEGQQWRFVRPEELRNCGLLAADLPLADFLGE